MSNTFIRFRGASTRSRYSPILFVVLVFFVILFASAASAILAFPGSLERRRGAARAFLRLRRERGRSRVRDGTRGSAPKHHLGVMIERLKHLPSGVPRRRRLGSARARRRRRQRPARRRRFASRRL